MRAVPEVQGPRRKAFCRPIFSQALRDPPTGLYRGPRLLRTLISIFPDTTPIADWMVDSPPL